ncbi:HoxN/HupN/NixA family nickel/cobalt transporter [Herbaspirillum chlorophenolicum]|uniref:HoxN/HupN/NixA family nickel/cobalt transporter n=1 Tax=Herbaspirillum chlorophenolicum TaxID=211589 RepID=UPI00067B3282|nr:hypothetical protein [Herbaspirillum chlorophenolicum]
MIDIASLLRQGAGNLWLLIPCTILLGALHRLEPAHSKTMMTTFIEAMRGMVSRAMLLGSSALFSHTAVARLAVLTGMYFGSGWSSESPAPYVQIAFGALLIGVVLWLAWRAWQRPRKKAQSRRHHSHETKWIDTGHGMLSVDIVEDNVPPRFRLSGENGQHCWPSDGMEIRTIRPNGARQTFKFVDRGDFLESIDEIPEPHAFMARVLLSHDGHRHAYNIHYEEHHFHHANDGPDASDS